MPGKLLKRFSRPKPKPAELCDCLHCGRERAAPNVPFCQPDWERVPSYLRKMILNPEKTNFSLSTLCASAMNYLRAVDNASEELRNEEPPAVKRRYFNPSRQRWEYEDGTPVEPGTTKPKPRDVIIPFGSYAGHKLSELPTFYLQWFLQNCEDKKNGLHEAAEKELSTRSDRESPKGHPDWTNGKGRL